MSNKLHKKKKQEEKKTYHTNQRIQKLLETWEEREKSRREHHTLIWLILFPPVGIYKSIRYKGFSPFLNVLFILLFCLILFFAGFLFVNPYDITNPTIEKRLGNYEDYGEMLEYKLIASPTIDDQDYYVYEVITNLGIYNVYLNRGSDMEIDYVSSRLNRTVLLDQENFEDFNNALYNEIFLFFQQEEQREKFGNLTGLITQAEGEQYDFSPTTELELEYQGIKTTKGNYMAGCIYNQVVQIYDLDQQEVLYQKKPELTMPNATMSMLTKNEEKTGTLETVFGFQWSSNASFYYLLNNENEIMRIEHNVNDQYILHSGDGEQDDSAIQELLSYIEQFESIE